MHWILMHAVLAHILTEISRSFLLISCLWLECSYFPHIIFHTLIVQKKQCIVAVATNNGIGFSRSSYLSAY